MLEVEVIDCNYTEESIATNTIISKINIILVKNRI